MGVPPRPVIGRRLARQLRLPRGRTMFLAAQYGIQSQTRVFIDALSLVGFGLVVVAGVVAAQRAIGANLAMNPVAQLLGLVEQVGLWSRQFVDGQDEHPRRAKAIDDPRRQRSMATLRIGR